MRFFLGFFLYLGVGRGLSRDWEREGEMGGSGRIGDFAGIWEVCLDDGMVRVVVCILLVLAFLAYILSPLTSIFSIPQSPSLPISQLNHQSPFTHILSTSHLPPLISSQVHSSFRLPISIPFINLPHLISFPSPQPSSHHI